MFRLLAKMRRQFKTAASRGQSVDNLLVECLVGERVDDEVMQLLWEEIDSAFQIQQSATSFVEMLAAISIEGTMAEAVTELDEHLVKKASFLLGNGD